MSHSDSGDVLFLSHAEEDSRLALGLALRLEMAGFPVWTYEVSSLFGPSYVTQTIAAIERCPGFLLILSRHVLHSSAVDKEVTAALRSGRSIIPILVDLTYDDFRKERPEEIEPPKGRFGPRASYWPTPFHNGDEGS